MEKQSKHMFSLITFFVVIIVFFIINRNKINQLIELYNNYNNMEYNLIEKEKKFSNTENNMMKLNLELDNKEKTSHIIIDYDKIGNLIINLDDKIREYKLEEILFDINSPKNPYEDDLYEYDIDLELLGLKDDLLLFLDDIEKSEDFYRLNNVYFDNNYSFDDKMKMFLELSFYTIKK